ncbi:hypothetical protein GW17_00044611 [Ensete ventricosum]|nr:hypothetical protein GW17_00044611 [Ensete ventricosum]
MSSLTKKAKRLMKNRKTDSDDSLAMAPCSFELSSNGIATIADKDEEACSSKGAASVICFDVLSCPA